MPKLDPIVLPRPFTIHSFQATSLLSVAAYWSNITAYGIDSGVVQEFRYIQICAYKSIASSVQHKREVYVFSSLQWFSSRPTDFGKSPKSLCTTNDSPYEHERRCKICFDVS